MEKHDETVLWGIVGVCAAAAGLLVIVTRQNAPIELLAHRLEDAWADHHTMVETT
jgi:hypothetical protein